MERTLTLFLLAIALTFLAAGQAPTIHWQHPLGGSANDRGVALELTADGGCVVVGYAESNNGDVSGAHGGADIWVVKLSPYGNIEWQQALGGTGDDIGGDIMNTSDGGYIVCGSTESNDGDVTLQQGVRDYWLIKLDASGNIQWQQTYGGSGFDECFKVLQTADGGYYAIGRAGSYDGDVSSQAGNFDVWAIKVDSAGVLQWEQSYGGSGTEYAYDVIEEGDGSFVFVGRTISTDGDISSNNGTWDVWLVKTDSLGNLLWERTYGGTSFDYGHSIVKTAGGYNVTGYSMSTDGDVGANNGTRDFWVLYVNNDGSVIWWEENLGGSFNDIAYSVERTPSNRVIVAGSTLSQDGDVSGAYGGNDFWLAELSNSGFLMWQLPLGGNTQDEAKDMEVAADGTYWVVGHSASTSVDVSGNNGSYDYWVVKLGPPLMQMHLKAMLGGPYDSISGLMNDDLRVAGLVPLVEPYTTSGYLHTGEGGGENTTASVLAVSGNNAIVDWVVVELRDAANPATVVNTRSALIQRDGDIVEVNGTSPLSMAVPNGNYHIAVRHRNHFGVMSDSAFAITNNSNTIMDLTDGSTSTYGIEAQQDQGGTWVSWSGNTISDTALKYIGTNNDRDPILVAIGGTVPTSTLTGYHPEDGNLDGVVKYTGSNNDRDPILINVGGNVPTNVRTEQLP